jgi:hypothetical protein
MKKALLTLLLVAAAALLGSSRALACGKSGGYSYAGLASPLRAYGIGATVTPLGPFDILAGHVAGWVGVGGPGEGPNGSDEWLQVGFSGFPSMTGTDLYYELTLPSGQPTYHQIASDLPAEKTTRFAVLEMHNRPSWWRVWVNGSPASQPIYLPESHGRWAPIATAESWDGGTAGACNGFLYRFDRVSIAKAPGGRWQPLNSTSAYAINSSSTKVRRGTSKASFLAAEGDDALRMLASYSG